MTCIAIPLVTRKEARAWWFAMRAALGTARSGTRSRSASNTLPEPAWLMMSAARAMSCASDGR